MKIKKMLSQNRRDFRAIFVCEHCNFEVELEGYDDANFHDRVIPSWGCRECGGKAPENYRALTTKYVEGFQI